MPGELDRTHLATFQGEACSEEPKKIRNVDLTLLLHAQVTALPNQEALAAEGKAIQ